MPRVSARRERKDRLATSNNFVMSGNDVELVLKYAKLSENAYAPTKGSEYAAGYDLRR